MTTNTKRRPYLHKFLLKNCFINYGIANGVVNAAIFYVLHMGSTGKSAFAAPSLMMDFALTSFILSVIVAFIIFGTIKSHVKKGKGMPCLPYTKEEHIVLKWFPKNIAGVAFLTAGLVTLLVPAFFVGAVSGLGIPLDLVGATVLKGITCMVAGMMTGYFCLLASLFRYSNPTTCLVEG